MVVVVRLCTCVCITAIQIVTSTQILTHDCLGSWVKLIYERPNMRTRTHVHNNSLRANVDKKLWTKLLREYVYIIEAFQFPLSLEDRTFDMSL